MHRNAPHTTRACALGALALLLGLPSTAAALPIISEVFYDAVGSDAGKSFVELYGAPGTDLSGFFIEGINGSNGAVTDHVALSGLTPADGFFVLADDPGDGTTRVENADQLADFDFQNGPDSVVLRFGDTVVDALGYGGFSDTDVFAGEGLPAPDAPPGSSLARWFADVDSGDNAADFGLQALPSPGSAPLVVPEPATSILLACGFAGLAGARRRRS